MIMAMEKIKVSEEERARRKDLGLPVTKPLRYMKRIPGGFSEFPVVDYVVIDPEREVKKRTVEVTLESGATVRIYEPYFADMQKPSFVDDMQQLPEEE